MSFDNEEKSQEQIAAELLAKEGVETVIDGEEVIYVNSATGVPLSAEATGNLVGSIFKGLLDSAVGPKSDAAEEDSEPEPVGFQPSEPASFDYFSNVGSPVDGSSDAEDSEEADESASSNECPAGDFKNPFEDIFTQDNVDKAVTVAVVTAKTLGGLATDIGSSALKRFSQLRETLAEDFKTEGDDV